MSVPKAFQAIAVEKSVDQAPLSAGVVQCQNCRKSPEPGETPLICSRCKHVRYCSVVCQRKHWKFHKKTCAPLGDTFAGFAKLEDCPWTLQDLKDFWAFHRTTLGAACVNAMKTYESPPLYDENENVLVIIVGFDPAQRANPAKRFGVVNASVHTIDELEEQYNNQIRPARTALLDDPDGHVIHQYTNLLVAGPFSLVVPAIVTESGVRTFGSRPMDVEYLLRRAIG